MAENPPYRQEPHATKPARYRIDHPSTAMPIDVRAWQMWAVHPLDIVEFKMSREEFYLAHLQAVKEGK